MPRYYSGELDGVAFIELFNRSRSSVDLGTRQRASAGVGMGGYLAVFRKPITRSVSRPAAAWS
jgi:hypothetical protein